MLLGEYSRLRQIIRTSTIQNPDRASQSSQLDTCRGVSGNLDSAAMSAKPPVYSIDDLEEYATRHLPKMVRDYFNGGALDSITLRANRQEYQKWYIIPRALRNVSKVDTSTKVFPGCNDIPFPCCVAPAAMQKMAHPLGEEATGKGCGRFGTVIGLSTFSTTSLEDVKRAADEGRRESGRQGLSECVLQMYLFENRETSKTLIRRAEGKDIPYSGHFSATMLN